LFSIISVALEGLENILKAGEKDKGATGVNPYATAIEEADGLDKLEALQNHQVRRVFVVVLINSLLRTTIFMKSP
jgi:hypothetical protein